MGQCNIYFLKTFLLKNALLLDLSIWTTVIEQNYITDLSESPRDMIQIACKASVSICASFRAVFDSCSSFFAPKLHGNACYTGYDTDKNCALLTV